jgi:hypothetical protein
MFSSSPEMLKDSFRSVPLKFGNVQRQHELETFGEDPCAFAIRRAYSVILGAFKPYANTKTTALNEYGKIWTSNLRQ